jgi:hypothetical protein
MQPNRPTESAQLAIDAASRGGDGWSGRLVAVVSLIAVTFSAFSLWETSLKAPDIRIFVPPVIQYANPYNNSNFEVISIPVTLTNEGARTGTVVSISLDVSEGPGKPVKRFYAADFGRWTTERTRALAYTPFAPIPLAGRTSRSENILFYPKGDDEKPPQIVREGLDVQFSLTLDLAEEPGLFDRLFKPVEARVTFVRRLRFFDARSFLVGTIPMDAKDWTSARSTP